MYEWPRGEAPRATAGRGPRRRGVGAVVADMSVPRTRSSSTSHSYGGPRALFPLGHQRRADADLLAELALRPRAQLPSVGDLSPDGAGLCGFHPATIAVLSGELPEGR